MGQGLYSYTSYTSTSILTFKQVYDTDGNILQAIDDHMLPSLISEVFSFYSQSPLEITELGCGTGRNTAKLLSTDFVSSQVRIGKINALDLSPGMLDVARKRCAEVERRRECDVEFDVFDALHPEQHQELLLSLNRRADLVLSTLVLEHLPIDAFFLTVKQFLKPGGLLLVTNMHSEMGTISQAGFVDTETGEKIQGTSFAHTVEEVLAYGVKEGFKLVGEVCEKGIEETDIEAGLVGPRGRKWIGVNVWYGFIMRGPE